jgi:hypothetical protein
MVARCPVSVPVCQHCGAAYTPHTPDCPHHGEPPPAAPHDAAMPSVAADVVRECGPGCKKCAEKKKSAGERHR